VTRVFPSAGFPDGFAWPQQNNVERQTGFDLPAETACVPRPEDRDQ
jgi:hypothetical protein